MSEKYVPKSFDDGDSDYRQFKDMQYRDELLGGAEQDSQRYEEAKAYDERLSAMQNRSEDDIYEEATQLPDAVDRAIAAGDPQVRFMKSLADQIAVLRNKQVDGDRIDRDIQALHDKEDSFNERLAEYESGENADPNVIERLMEIATSEPGTADEGAVAEEVEAATRPTDEEYLDTEPYTPWTPPAAPVKPQFGDGPQQTPITNLDGVDGAQKVVGFDGKDTQVVAAQNPESDGDSETGPITVVNPEDAKSDLDAAVAAVNEKDPANAKKSYAEMLQELKGLTDEEQDEKLSAIWEGASEEERQKLILAAFGPEEYATIRPEDVASWESGTIQRIVLDALNNGEPQAKTEGLNDLERSKDRIENLPQPEGFLSRGRNWARERWDNTENRRYKVARALTGVALTVMGITAAVVIAKNGGDHSAVLDTVQNIKGGFNVHGTVGETLANGNWNIPNGGGLLEAMRTNGVDTAKLTHDYAQHLIDSYPTEFEWHGSDIWISNPGDLSSQAAADLESLK